MKHLINRRYPFAGFVAAILLLLSVGAMAFVAQAAPLAQTATDFDNTIFILSPAVRPERFVDCVDNPYYPMIPGTVYHYEAETEDGLETVTVTVTNQIKQVMGISTTVLHDVERLNGVLVEDTYDWYAQDKSGNVWYFGEDTTSYNLEDGTVSNEGSWEAGVDGAVPGIIMLADPVVGDVYREEYWQGEATDMAAVAGLNESTSTAAMGDFDNALLTTNYNPLDNELEHKYYVPGLGLVAEQLIDGNERVELVAISHDVSLTANNQACGGDNGVAFVGTLPVTGAPDNLQDLAQISAEEAEQIAVDANPGATVTSTELEVEHGFLVYEVTLDTGMEVIIDAGDGALLATEPDDEDADDADDADDTDDADDAEDVDEGEEADDEDDADDTDVADMNEADNEDVASDSSIAACGTADQSNGTPLGGCDIGAYELTVTTYLPYLDK